MKKANLSSESPIFLGDLCSDLFWYLSLRPSPDVLRALLKPGQWELKPPVQTLGWPKGEGRRWLCCFPRKQAVRLQQELAQVVVSFCSYGAFVSCCLGASNTFNIFQLRSLCLAQLHFWSILFRGRSHQNKRKACGRAGSAGCAEWKDELGEVPGGSHGVLSALSFRAFPPFEEWLLLGRGWVYMPLFWKGSYMMVQMSSNGEGEWFQDVPEVFTVPRESGPKSIRCRQERMWRNGGINE